MGQSVDFRTYRNRSSRLKFRLYLVEIHRSTQ